MSRADVAFGSPSRDDIGQSDVADVQHVTEDRAASSGAGPAQHPPHSVANKTSEIFGEIVWLMGQSPDHQKLLIQDLECVVMAPILLRQFRLFRTDDRPIGALFWAHATQDVAAKIAHGIKILQPKDWDGRRAANASPPSPKTSTGTETDSTREQQLETQIWVVTVIAPFGGTEEMIQDFRTQVHPEQPVHYIVEGPEGPETRVL